MCQKSLKYNLQMSSMHFKMFEKKCFTGENIEVSISNDGFLLSSVENVSRNKNFQDAFDKEENISR